MKRPAHITLVNGVETSAINIADRGLAYGDGLFETMRVINGDIPLLDRHLARFLKGVSVLNLGEEKRLKQDFLHYVKSTLHEIRDNACLDASVLKLMVTRGAGGRGYIPPEEPHHNVIAQVFDLPSYPDSYYDMGVNVKVCQYRLAYQPQLSGIKHLNRLDQVLASQELFDAPEGIVLDYEGRIIEGTKSNLLLFKGKRVFTPDLSGSGVHGVLRNVLLDTSSNLGIKIEQANIKVEALPEYDGVAFINSVFGIWPVHQLTLLAGETVLYQKNANFQQVRDYLSNEYGY